MWTVGRPLGHGRAASRLTVKIRHGVAVQTKAWRRAVRQPHERERDVEAPVAFGVRFGELYF